MIEQPKRAAGPETSNRYHAICSCGRVVVVDTADRVIPKHTYRIDPNPLWGIPGGDWPCDQSGKLHGT